MTRRRRLVIAAFIGLAGCNTLFGLDAYDNPSDDLPSMGGGGAGASLSTSTSTTTTASVATTSSVGGSGGGGAGAAGGSGGTGGASDFIEVGGAAVVSFGERSNADVQNVTIDNTVTSMSPTFNWGDSDLLFMDGAGTTASGVLRFDLARIEPGTQVTDARLDVYVPGEAVCQGPGTTVRLHELLETWVEGTLFGADGVSNYTERMAGVPWTTPGARLGSHDTPQFDSFSNAMPGDHEVLDIPNGVVQDWIDDPTSNFGLVLVTDEGDGVCIVSSEGASTERPLLVLDLSTM